MPGVLNSLFLRGLSISSSSGILGLRIGLFADPEDRVFNSIALIRV